jgi:hypothetical protein
MKKKLGLLASMNKLAETESKKSNKADLKKLQDEYREFLSENYMHDNDGPTFEEWLNDGHDEEFEIKTLHVGAESDEETLQLINQSGSHVARVEMYPLLENGMKICEAVNNYQALRDSNAELMENLERILDRIKESDLILCFPSAYKRAKEALNKAKSIK